MGRDKKGIVTYEYICLKYFIFINRTLALSTSGVSNLNGNSCQWFVRAEDVYSYVLIGYHDER